RMRPRLSPGSGLSTPTQSHLSRRRVPDPPLPLYARSSGWAHHLAAPVHHVQSGLHGLAPLRLALSLDATGSGSGCAVGHTWRTELRALCGALSHLADGPLSPRLCVRPPQFGHGADLVWAAAPGVFPGG